MGKVFIGFNKDLKLSQKLAGIRETEEHSYILSKPLDIYLRKLSDVENSLTSLINFMKNDYGYSSTITHPIRIYVQTLATFYDNIFRILKYTQDLNGIEDSQNAIIWLNKHGTSKNKNFFKNTKAQQILISLIDNKLKHDDVVIQHCGIIKKYLNRNSKEVFDIEVKGFYICSIINKDQLWASDTDIHPPMNGNVSTSISYNFFVLNTIYSLIHWINELSRILPNANSDLPIQSDSLSNILEIASQIPEEFFPDEYKKAYAKIQKNEKGYELLYPYQFKNTSKVNLLLQTNLIGGMHYDSRANRSFQKIPYLNLSHNDWQ